MAGNPPQPDQDLSAEADEALEVARSMPPGHDKVEALKKAGLMRNVALMLAGLPSRSVEDRPSESCKTKTTRALKRPGRRRGQHESGSPANDYAGSRMEM
jgi:hypothetical protein